MAHPVHTWFQGAKQFGAQATAINGVTLQTGTGSIPNTVAEFEIYGGDFPPIDTSVAAVLAESGSVNLDNHAYPVANFFFTTPDTDALTFSKTVPYKCKLIRSCFIPNQATGNHSDITIKNGANTAAVITASVAAGTVVEGVQTLANVDFAEGSVMSILTAKQTHVDGIVIVTVVRVA